MIGLLSGFYSARLKAALLVQKPWLQLRVYAQYKGLQANSKLLQRWQTNIAAHGQQAIPLKGFYAEMLEQPAEKVQPATRTSPTPPPPDELPKTDKEETLSKARVIFGSRLAGPAERCEELNRASIDVAGVMVPPRPSEPDNCCMSGCVNCVWDRYRDELEEWASASALARERLQAQREKARGTGLMLEQPGMPTHVATGMDDDGGGSETNWSSGLAMSGEGGDLFGDIPVGIREFMRTEKMLKQRHLQEQSMKN